MCFLSVIYAQKLMGILERMSKKISSHTHESLKCDLLNAGFFIVLVPEEMGL